MIKSFWFVPKSDVAPADWPAFGQDRINAIGKPSALAGGLMYEDVRVSYHLAMVEELFFLPSAIVVGDITDDKGD